MKITCICQSTLYVLLSVPAANAQAAPSTAVKSMTRAEAAKRLAVELDLKTTNDPVSLFGLFPGIFPGGYDGTLDLAYPDKPATLENIIVTLVRWAGWDTVHYDTKDNQRLLPYVSPEGFPHYAPDPTPRSIPYISVALRVGLLQEPDLAGLRTPIRADQIAKFARAARHIDRHLPLLPPLTLTQGTKAEIAALTRNPTQVAILPTGFRNYALIEGLRNRIVDLNAPGLRILSGASSIRNGKQDYFPLGPLDSLLTVALHVPKDSYAHQSQAIYGMVENASTTVNAVGLWGSASSLGKDARVWGGFIKAATTEGPENDAQLVGLEVDVISSAQPGVPPYRSKTGIQIVGIGTQAVTNALEIIGAGPAKWGNGILFNDGSILSIGAVMGYAGGTPVSRGIDFANANFTNAALLLNVKSPISFRSKEGNAALIYTDEFGAGHLVIKAGAGGLRIADNGDSKNLLEVKNNGDLVTPLTSLSKLKSDVEVLQKSVSMVGIGGQRVPSPTASSQPCSGGDWAADNNFFYLCTPDSRWRRAALSAW